MYKITLMFYYADNHNIKGANHERENRAGSKDLRCTALNRQKAGEKN
jgi:hypothetical protein